jgi:ABC-type nickel/cobalt efflux system permease component RcnA
MTPVPPEKTAVRLELVPVSMVGGAATKLVMMAGTALTVTVVVAVTASPLLGVTVSV